MSQKQNNPAIERLARLDAERAAKELLGWKLVRCLSNTKLTGKIVETEAYHQEDAASHSYRGKTPRTEVMFGPAGHAYVYFTYGMHYCMNVVVGKDGQGAAVLIRALEPISGLELMAQHRGREPLTNGPAKLCQALAIDRDLNGHNLSRPPLVLAPGKEVGAHQIVATTRIGIKDNAQATLRFYIKDNPYVSQL